MKRDMPLHDGHRERLRERYEREGLKNFQPHEVLELVLTFTIPRIDVNPIAHRLIKHFGNIFCVFDASIEELCQLEGVGRRSAVLIHLFKDMFRTYEMSKFGDKVQLSKLSEIFEYCKNLLMARAYETVLLINLDSQRRVINRIELQEGSITEVQLYIRKVIEAAMRAKAYGVLLAHNHPNGKLMPSSQDVKTTIRVIEALKTVEIEFLDHIIVADNQCMSMCEGGFLNRNMMSL